MTVPRPPRVILFDFDGTLFQLSVDWTALKHEVSSALATAGVLPSSTGLWDLFAAAPPPLRSTLCSIIDRHELAGVKHGTSIEGVTEFLAVLRERSIPVAIVSRNGRAAVEAGLKRAHVPPPAILVCRDDVTRQKPDPESLNLAFERLHRTRDGALMVGDSIHDLAAAHALDLPAALRRNPHVSAQPLAEADLVFAHYAELTQALLLVPASLGLYRNTLG